MAFAQIPPMPIYTFFPNAVERLVVRRGLHSRHPLYPFVPCLNVSPYIEKSCMHQISIALRQNVRFLGLLDTLVAFTPFHSCNGSSIKEAKYTSMLSHVILSLPGINRINIIKNCFVSNHEGRL